MKCTVNISMLQEKTIEMLIENQGKIIPVGTTSVRTLESLYWLGVKLINNPSANTDELITRTMGTI